MSQNFWEAIWQVSIRVPAESRQNRFEDSLQTLSQRYTVQWNPTGDIFEVRPDLARLTLEELTEAVRSMREQLASVGEEVMRVQISRFERQYTAALWQRAAAENIETVVIGSTTYHLILTSGRDVILTSQS
jgi:hypothetical protein